jgi:hypothetical protein
VSYRSRPRGARVLMWILLIILALIVASVLFGGFQKGTKSTLPAPASLSDAHSTYSVQAASASGRLR